MEQNKTISIAIITYNGERFLRKLLDSIYNQTYKNIEVIACDDKSTDRTAEILEEYKQKYGLKYYINEVNIGFVKNLEKTAKLCNGEYIAFADQDDIWMPEKLEVLLREIGENFLICSDAKLIDDEGILIEESFSEFTGLSPDISKFTDSYIKFFTKSNFVIGCTAMITKEFLDIALPIPDKFPYHDWWFALNATALNKIKYLPDKLILYRQHNNNHTGANKTKIGFLYSILPNFSYFSKQSKYNKRKNLQTFKDISTCILEKKLAETEEETQFLLDSIDHYSTLLESKINFRTITFLIKNKNLLYPDKNILLEIVKYSLFSTFT